MFTASQKKKENIAEYLLYMWQLEDLIRAYGLDIDKIQAAIIDQYPSLTEAQRKELRDWYESLIDMMRREGVEKSGHLQLNKNTVGDLADLTKRLLADPKFSAFANQYYATLPIIVELRAKSGDNPESVPGEIEACFNALYGVLLLRLQKKPVSPQTQAAVDQISKFLAMLAAYYRKDQSNDLFTPDHP